MFAGRFSPVPERYCLYLALRLFHCSSVSFLAANIFYERMSLKLLAPADSKFPTKFSREDIRNQLNQKSRILHKSGKKAFKSNRIDRTLNQRVPGSSPPGAPTNKASNLICLQTTDTTAPKACEFVSVWCPHCRPLYGLPTGFAGHVFPHSSYPSFGIGCLGLGDRRSFTAVTLC